MNLIVPNKRPLALLTILVAVCCAVLGTIREPRAETSTAPVMSAAATSPGDCAVVGRSASAEMQKLLAESETFILHELSASQPGNDCPSLSGAVPSRDAPTLQSQAVRLQI